MSERPATSVPQLTGPRDGGVVPPLLRFLALNLGIGVGIGIAVAALIVIGNVGGLKTLLKTADSPWLAMFLLYFMCALTFGSLSMGVGVMTMPYDKPDADDDDGDGGGEPPR